MFVLSDAGDGKILGAGDGRESKITKPVLDIIEG